MKLPYEYQLLTVLSNPLFEHSDFESQHDRIKDGTNWLLFHKLCRRHRVAPLVYFNITKHNLILPAETFIPIKEMVASNAYNMLQLTGLLNDMSGILSRAFIPYIAFKGPVLALQLYGNISMRQSRDLDLLVKPADVIRVAELLHTHQFIFDPPEFCSKDLTHQYFRIYRNLSLRHTGSGRRIEIHWRMFDHSDEPDWFGMTEKITVSGVVHETLNLPANLLYLALHGHHHRWNELGWIADFLMLEKKIADVSAIPFAANPWVQSAINIAHTVYPAVSKKKKNTLITKTVIKGLINEHPSGLKEKLRKLEYLCIAYGFLILVKHSGRVLTRYRQRLCRILKGKKIFRLGSRN